MIPGTDCVYGVMGGDSFASSYPWDGEEMAGAVDGVVDLPDS